ncbi:winged helix DNA-binding protein [Aneurinibacillus thermoaerophilus]|uniref:MarR family winged helix-turn-helix transcriptional regulator n=1 Tax=Aneurinibacillus thermoaerophilus TaxID=143495 RepID=UPI002E22F729|nr:winged helix DNA-binding protein [Aneurinibacillus thermoaerophilus]MED0680615.1 winged helix DNA-binding protein [Aneurinibacillus thermoaerophilus]MED0762765.1 winged helix DNA-binding protein [Aneurinibacillus thermoaerophilus]
MNEEIAKEYIALIPNLFGSFSELNKDSVELSHMQNHVIEFMYMQQRALNLKEISTGLNIAKQQLTNIIRDLEVGGYLVKMPDPKDKRAVLVSLTPAGKEIEDKKWTKIYQRFSENLTKLSDEEKLDLHFALHKVNVLLKKMED